MAAAKRSNALAAKKITAPKEVIAQSDVAISDAQFASVPAVETPKLAAVNDAEMSGAAEKIADAVNASSVASVEISATPFEYVLVDGGTFSSGSVDHILLAQSQVEAKTDALPDTVDLVGGRQTAAIAGGVGLLALIAGNNGGGGGGGGSAGEDLGPGDPAGNSENAHVVTPLLDHNGTDPGNGLQYEDHTGGWKFGQTSWFTTHGATQGTKVLKAEGMVSLGSASTASSSELREVVLDEDGSVSSLLKSSDINDMISATSANNELMYFIADKQGYAYGLVKGGAVYDIAPPTIVA